MHSSQDVVTAATMSRPTQLVLQCRVKVLPVVAWYVVPSLPGQAVDGTGVALAAPVLCVDEAEADGE